MLWAILALPFFARDANEPNIALLVAVAVVMVLAAIQWLALMRKFGFDPPILPAVLGVIAALVFAAYWGQIGALVGLAVGLVGSYGWRITVESPTRFADAAYSVGAAALLGFLPAQLLILRRLDGGITGTYLVLIGLIVFGAVQAILSRPARDGTRYLATATGFAALASIAVVTLAGVIRGGPFSFGASVIIALAIAIGATIGRGFVTILLPAPERGARPAHRRPMLADALLPICVASAAGFFAVRAVLAV